MIDSSWPIELQIFVCSYSFDASVGNDYGEKWTWFQPIVGGYSNFC